MIPDMKPPSEKSLAFAHKIFEGLEEFLRLLSGKFRLEVTNTELRKGNQMSAHISDPISDMFVQYKTIAVVGLSAKLDRPQLSCCKVFERAGLPDYSCNSNL